MKRHRALAVWFLAAVLQGCSALSTGVGGLADAPTQIVMVRTTAEPGALRAVYALAFPPGGGEISSNLAPNGIGPSPPAGQPVAGRIPPGIAANSDTYVVAAWGTYDDVNYRLNLYASENGRSWSSAECPAALVGTDLERGNSPEASRPAATYFPPRRTWFVAVRERANGAIMLAEFDIAGSGSTGSIPPYTCTAIGNLRSAGVASDHAPALGYVGNRLVIAYTTLRPAAVPPPPPPQRPTSLELFALTSPDGMTFTSAPGTQIVDPTTLAPTAAQSLEPVGPPYLSNTLGDLTLTAGFRPPANRFGNPVTGVFTSTDGLNWTTVTTLPPNFGSGYGPVSAGSTSDRIIAIPRLNRQGFFVSIAGAAPVSRVLVGSYGAGLAKGPGPIATTTHACAPNQPLRARTTSGDVTGFGLRPKAFMTNGDFELTCDPPPATTTRSGVCSANTTYATVRGNVAAGSYIVECWRRLPG